MAVVSETSGTESHWGIEMLMRLARLTGRRFDAERLRGLLAFEGGVAVDPMAQLAPAVRELGLKLTPARMSLADALWHSQPGHPVIVWSEAENRYLIVVRAGAFKVKLAVYGQENLDFVTLSRAGLAARMGLSSVSAMVEVGLVLPMSPVDAASIESELIEERLAGRHGARSHSRAGAGHHGHGDGDAGHHPHMDPTRRFFRLLKPESRDIFVLLGFALFSSILYLAVPFAVDTVVTNLAFGAQAKPYVQALVVIAQILAVCLLLQALVIGFQYYVAEVIQRRIFVRTAADLAFRLPRVSARAFDGVHGPELVNRFLDVVTVQKNTTFFLLDGINVLAASLIGMLLLTLYHPLLLVLVVVLVPLIVGLTWLLGRKAVKTAIEESRSKYDLVSWFEEISAYPRMFKGPGGHELAYERANLLATQYVDARRRHFSVVIRQVSGLLALSVISSVALLLLGTWLVLSQQITLGQLVASELIMSGIVASLVKLGKKLEVWYDTMAATDKLGHLFDLETESTTGEEPPTSVSPAGIRVVARDMGFEYPSGPPLFEHLGFTLEPGECVALYGPQGSGVSSMLDLLFALRQPTGGHLSFDGLDSRSWQPERLRESVQLLRRDEFIDGSLLDNLRLGRIEIGQDEIRVALEAVGMLDDCLRHPDGFNQRLRVGGSPMSTTQRISLLMARALVHKPRLLLIDELLDGLDEVTFRRLVQCVVDRKGSWTVVVGTRMREVMSFCDRVIDLAPSASATDAKGSPLATSRDS